jgi:diadenosine tetraphosphate (Ap4A) HIT family hydrolase
MQPPRETTRETTLAEIDSSRDACHACQILAGKVDLPGGPILQTTAWVVEHELGPLGVGTLLVKPIRHCIHLGQLTDEEAVELGPLLKATSGTVQRLTGCDQVYVCLWAHSGWRPVHVHFIVQPAWDDFRHNYPRPGPFVQSAMFEAATAPDRQLVEEFCERARDHLKSCIGTLQHG